jgi:hypothetical protein
MYSREISAPEALATIEDGLYLIIAQHQSWSLPSCSSPTFQSFSCFSKTTRGLWGLSIQTDPLSPPRSRLGWRRDPASNIKYTSTKSTSSNISLLLTWFPPFHHHLDTWYHHCFQHVTSQRWFHLEVVDCAGSYFHRHSLSFCIHIPLLSYVTMFTFCC